MRQENLQSSQEYKTVPKRKPAKKRKSLGYRFYAWLKEGSKEIDFQAGCEVSKRSVYCPATEDFLDTRTADWICVSSVNYAFKVIVVDTLEDGTKIKRREIGKRTENVKHIFLCALDFDGSEYLTEDAIIQRLRFLNLPLPTHIIKTRAGHYQALWILEDPLKKSQVGFWQVVVNALFQVFSACEEDKELFGCDPKVLNPAGYVRHPYNPKYQRFDTGRKVSLSELYKALKQADVIQLKNQGSKKPRRKGEIPSHISQHRILTFLRANSGIITTYRELFRACNVKESTGYLLMSGLRASGKITVENVRAGRTWKTKFTLKVHTLRKEYNKKQFFVGGGVVGGEDSLVFGVGREVKDGSFKINNSGERDLFIKSTENINSLGEEVKSNCLERGFFNFKSFFYPEEEELSALYDNVGIKGSIFVELTKIISRVGFPFRWRNKGVFMISLGLKSCGFTNPEDVLNLLTPGFYICQYIGDHTFSREEFERTVKSAFKFKYRYCVGFENRDWDWKDFLRAVYKLLREFENKKVPLVQSHENSLSLNQEDL